MPSFIDISEKNLEATIEAVLLADGPDAAQADQNMVREELRSYGAGRAPFGGFRKRLSKQYDRTSCLIEDDAVDFVADTQPEQWRKLRKLYPGDAREQFLARLSKEITKRGTLDVLRKGIRLEGCAFRLAYFTPSTSLNDDLHRRHEANIFAVARQLICSTKGGRELDLALFLNGLPLFTVELKNPLTQQSVEDAIVQYKATRDPHEPLFAFGRCLAHFAVSTDEVYMTTHLRGSSTTFLPFNKGNNGGRGNPPALHAYATAYLWEEIWTRASILDLIEHFVMLVEVEDDNGKKTGEKKLIFPRYHQLDTVRRLRAASRTSGAGHRYLIQHSAGSGKSNSIVWLAYQLATLHDAEDRRVFDSVIVITDRRILDRQLQRNMIQFERTPGVLENIDTTSRKLKTALEDGKTIIVCTLQKFLVIAGEMKELAGERFAVIVDEAHSSQGKGAATSGVTRVLTAGGTNAAPDDEEEQTVDADEPARQAVLKRHFARNASYFAFTATPKKQTLELFGTPDADGKYHPFSLYSMRQAIEEGFILDVLKNYITFATYFNLLKKIEADPHVDRARAARVLKAAAESNPRAIERKAAIMLEHFMTQVYDRRLVDGRAKGMIVTGSRLSAVHYKLAIDAAITAKGYGIRTLVAFSGSVEGPADIGWTESGMNGGIAESKTAETFKGPEYRLLIVANKFQTGFDQPMLQTMYVDKKLQGVNAVQTLSRLNRTFPGKTEVFVLDFANKAEDIQKSFQPYYDRTILAGRTDPNLLYDLEHRMLATGLHTQQDVEAVADAYFGPKGDQQRLQAAIDVVAERIGAADPEEREEYRGLLTGYAELYPYLAQIVEFVEPGLEKLNIFCEYLLRKLPGPKRGLPPGLERAVDMKSCTVKKSSEGSIGLERGRSELPRIGEPPAGAQGPGIDAPLSEVVEELNKRFGTDFSPGDTFMRDMEAKLDDDTALAASVELNSEEKSLLAFKQKLERLMQEQMEKNFSFYKSFNDDPEFQRALIMMLFERYVRRRGFGR